MQRSIMARDETSSWDSSRAASPCPSHVSPSDITASGARAEEPSAQLARRWPWRCSTCAWQSWPLHIRLRSCSASPSKSSQTGAKWNSALELPGLLALLFRPVFSVASKRPKRLLAAKRTAPSADAQERCLGEAPGGQNVATCSPRKDSAMGFGWIVASSSRNDAVCVCSIGAGPSSESWRSGDTRSADHPEDWSRTSTPEIHQRTRSSVVAEQKIRQGTTPGFR
mmetsp:Transcript_69933/g.163592  ORF Transcript_69933/g.163592 Transcript_69933/m.163592 type:complete len:225 (-) Transcript_69933:1605-2279(-)